MIIPVYKYYFKILPNFTMEYHRKTFKRKKNPTKMAMCPDVYANIAKQATNYRNFLFC